MPKWVIRIALLFACGLTGLRRALLRFWDCWFGAAIFEQSDHFLQALLIARSMAESLGFKFFCRRVENGLAVFVAGIDIGARGQQCLDVLKLRFFGNAC